MRISDWSSDVCSSDLAQERYNNKDVTEGVFESDSVGFDEEVARRGDGRRLAHFDNPAASSAVERTEEQDSRDSRGVSFNGDVTWLISDDTSLRVDAFALTTKRKEHQATRVYDGHGSVGGLTSAERRVGKGGGQN